MTKLVIYIILLFGIFTIKTVSHMNSDPAPGRSPGPPTTNEADDAVDGVLNEADEQLRLNQPELSAGFPDNSLPFSSNRNSSNNNNNIKNNNSENNNDNNEKSFDDNADNSEIEFSQTHRMQNVADIRAIDGHNSPIDHDDDGDTKLPAANDKLRLTSNDNLKHFCREDLSEFLNDILVIDLDEMDDETSMPTTSTTNESERQAQRRPPPLSIQLLVEHDVFETNTRTAGLNCGLMYKVRLLTSAPLTTISSSKSEPLPGSSTATSSSTSSPAPAHYMGEFFVESLSSSNEQERGSFVGHSLGNKLPISWFSSLHHSSGSGSAREGDGGRSTTQWLNNAAVGINDDRNGNGNSNSNSDTNEKNDFISSSSSSSDEDNFDFMQQQHQQQKQQRKQKSSATTPDRRKLSENGERNECRDNRWRDNTKSHLNATGNGFFTESLNLWMVNELCERDDIIQFRVFFHQTMHSNANIANEANIEAQHIIYKKAFQFRLQKDCHLWLREATTSGTLDYTTLPLYNNDCRVHFPSYDHLSESPTGSHTPTTPNLPPPGLLIELQRLNVPCSNGGYVQFNERSRLCGKLEELQDADRVYHFDVRRHTDVHFHLSPMFSLSYKLVDYCYNMTSSNETGEFYIRPSMRDSLECYFRVHLPYGNRILLQLVTNNDTEIMPARGEGWPYMAGESVNIWTSHGHSVDTQMVNLTRNGSDFMATIMDRTVFNGVVNRTNGSEQTDMNGGGSSGDGTASGGSAFESYAFAGGSSVAANCDGIIIKVFENDLSKWSFCVNGSAQHTRGFVMQSSGNTLSIHLYRPPPFGGHKTGSTTKMTADESTKFGIYLSYQARPISEIVSNCAFGWIAMQQFCVSAMETSVSWPEAEKHCSNLGGHLASIHNDAQQEIVNELLLHSPGYHHQNAYWVGGSDLSNEGEFRWSDGLAFQYTNWFSGWTQHGHYNKQPNDDGLSSQDCIELRRYFRSPPGVQTNRSPLTSTYMWNDRDCSAKNFYICERAMTDESFGRNWINDCNKTVSLSKEHPRASIWSPSFPRQYPDNANCFTTITAPPGYRIVLEFEELVIENEPGCTYDYLELTEPSHADAIKSTKSSKRKTSAQTDNIATMASSSTKTYQKRNSYENPSLNSNSNSNTNANSNLNTNTNTNANDNNYSPYNNYNNYNLAQMNYQKLLHIFSSLYRPHSNFIVLTPDYPKGNPRYLNRVRMGGNRMMDDESPPKRLCGDWSSKLKLLRHISTGSYLGLHFVSDYSHHFGGYKAKVYMENRSPATHAVSECANERLKPYNGSCYLFVSYPEVDWWTAQQVCHAMGAKLSSVSSSDEHRFITSNIRNQIDYSPQLIYWLGGELEKSGQFEWTDDTKMSFQGWLPGQEQVDDERPSQATCLGLQWKMSPTPMLPSGLYWQSQKCSKPGGYVCKKPRESFGDFAFNNFTVTGIEGRLVSPAYPNSYPLNLDYWIHIKSPERTRIIVQFQKIDLEPQDECLYDFVSIEDYELVSRITLEPGSNVFPMAMLASEELMSSEHDSSSGPWRDKNNAKFLYRERRSVGPLRKRNISGGHDDNVRRKRKRTQNERKTDGRLMAQSEIQIDDKPHKNRKREYIKANTNGGEGADFDRYGGNGGGDDYDGNQGQSGTNSHDDECIESKGDGCKVAGGRRSGDSSDSPKNDNMRQYQHHSHPHLHFEEINENPKRRRRKKPPATTTGEIANNLRKYSSQRGEDDNNNDIVSPRRNSLPEMPIVSRTERHQRRRKRRSTLTLTAENSIMSSSLSASDNAQSFLPYVRWCGSHVSNMSKFDFVSNTNGVVINFHSDYSITGLGFAATWKAIDVSGCPLQTLTSREGTVLSPNYPHFLLNNLNCAYVIQAPAGRRVWLEIIDFSLISEALLEVDIGNGLFKPFRMKEHLNDGIFVSIRDQLRVQFRTGQHPRGKGFQAIYRTVAQLESRERIIYVPTNASGYLLQLNYPHDTPENIDFTQHLIAPFGSIILLELYGVEFNENGCMDNNILEIYDHYSDNNGTKWQLCKFHNTIVMDNENQSNDGNNNDDTNDDDDDDDFAITEYTENPYESRRRQQRQRQRQRAQQYVVPPPPIYITSYLNTLHIRQRVISGQYNANLNATLRIQNDNNYKMKLTSGDKSVESCQPNPCQYNGKCLSANGTNYCQCQGHYTGRFCGLNICELEPCVFGKCELTATNFKCQCQPGYMGSTCEQKQRPCADNPCEGRGMCIEKNGGFFCRCHAWWEGPKCERRMLHIPYKPLSERMLQEPFWLGLITVFVVLAVIGLVWCAKRHFPEKIEKLLAEEADRNRPPGSLHGHHHHTSLREQLQFTTAIPQATISTAPGAPRSIFNRLGIRKPSLLSLSSPNPIPAGGGGAAARTFSLDDLLRPPPRRSPSPRKKRNNSTPVKKNAAEKKQILQQLVSPATGQVKPKVSLGELISMSENRLRANNLDSESDLKETTFSENSGSLPSSSAVARTIADPKLEKKVTFARLLNKVSAEMSSGSEIDIGQMAGTRNSSALSLPTDIQYRTSSMPPSPCTNDIRSPHSTSSNQGSDSLSSSDLALTDFGLRSMPINDSSNLLMSGSQPSARFRIGSTARPKVSSADSILAMFRNFAPTSSATSNTNTNTGASMPSNASIFISPSTTPTISSPQDDAPGDDESSTSSMHTPVSFSSGAPDSPVFYRQTTIEVPVLDVLNAHKSPSPSSSTSSSSTNLLHPPTILLELPSNGINNKCLSPIREMPTPIPSPALTPVMPRPHRSNSPIFQEDPLSGADFSDDDDDDDNDDNDNDGNGDGASQRSDHRLSEQIMLGLEKHNASVIESEVNTISTDTTTTAMADINRMPTLRLTSKSPPITACNAQTSRLVPMITIDIEPPTPEERAPRPRDLIIPTLTVEQPSPTKNRQPMIIFPGSPPPQRASIGETSFMFPNKQQQKRLLKQFEKPTSLEFPFVPPMITVTSNMSELESDDTEPFSPAPKTGAGATGGLMPPNPVGMTYLSPFTMCSRADRTISESNLSSSGYSSMASPGPSRCGSSNPLCPNEMDEPGSGHSGAGFSLHVNLMNRRKSSTLASCKENVSNGKGSGSESGASGSNTDQMHGHRQRSDSETFSDDILIESNDEGIGTDHVDEKLDDSRQNSDSRFQQMAMFLEEDQVLIEVEEPPPTIPIPIPVIAAGSSANTGPSQMAQLQLPSIVIQIEGNEKGLSPVSSRSESPLSERAGIGRFSPHFYGRKDQLPFTDSDGLYDFPSSDGKGGTSAQTYSHQRRSSSKKRERKLSKCSASTQSPTKQQQLDVPSRDSLNTTLSPCSSTHHVCNKHCHSHQHPCPAAAVTSRKSPKRRLVSRMPIASSSSSSESLASTKEANARPLPRRLNSPNREKQTRKQESLSEEDIADALLRRISPSIVKEDESTRPKCKINRLRAIGNQIRFLRRLKKSIKTRERLSSPSDSCPEENTDELDSPQATSPLLKPPSPSSKNRVGAALCRQKRLPSGTYNMTMTTTTAAKTGGGGAECSLIDDDVNSD